ncbi:MAG: amidase [Proteobacteria bacterium]|nr:amidase [Pseudomonadota bacterium]
MTVLSQAEKNPDCLAELSKKFRVKKSSVLGYLTALENLFGKREPLVQAFISEPADRFDRLRQEFARLESRFPEVASRPPLYGVPVGVKDIFHVESFPTRGGSRLPAEILSGPEAKCVRTLKSAGALVLGKTVTTEFAYFAPGPTRNPHNLEHTPGGSSSGSAAAVAAGLCPLSLGTQTIGSILRPASYCGVVGFKPSYGQIPIDGVIPLAPSVDHVGFFTADVEGAILAASVLLEVWTGERQQSPPVWGVPEGPYLEKASREGLHHFRKTSDRLSKAGVQIEAVEMFQDFDRIAARHHALVAAEAAIAHRDWFQDYSGSYHEKTAQLIRTGQTVDSNFLETCRAGRQELRGLLMKEIERRGLSGFLAPSAVGPAPRGLDSTGDPVMNLPWTYAGLPTVNLPSGVSREGLPLGLQLVGSWMGDKALLEMAKQIGEVLE